MQERLSGKVLWYRPQSGQGMVRADDGRRFFFHAAAAVATQPEEGLRVVFDLGRPEGGGGVEALAIALEGGVRRVEAVLKDNPRHEKKKQQSAARAESSERKPKATVVPPRRVPPRPLAMAPGTQVHHPMWGPGHVVAATEHVVSVEFLSEIRKSFRPDELADLSGPQVPKAPEPRTRNRKSLAEAAGVPTPAGHDVFGPRPSPPRVIRRAGDTEGPTRE